MGAYFPFTVAVIGTATLFGHLVDSATDARASDLLSLALLFLSLFGLKPFHIEAIVTHIDDGTVGEADAIVMVIGTGDDIAVLVEFVHKSVIRSGVEDTAQVRYRLADVGSWGGLDGDTLRMVVIAYSTKNYALLLIGGAERLEPSATVVGTQRGQDVLWQLVGGISITDVAIQELGAELATKEPIEFLGGQVDIVIQHLVNEGIYLLETLFIRLELEQFLDLHHVAALEDSLRMVVNNQVAVRRILGAKEHQADTKLGFHDIL